MTEEVADRLNWWMDWRKFQILPWPGNDLSTQPAFVYDVIRLCEETHDAAAREEAEKCPKSA